MSLPASFLGNILPNRPVAPSSGSRPASMPGAPGPASTPRSPGQRPVTNILRPVPTDQFDRGIDLLKTAQSGGGGGGATTGDWPLKLVAVDTENVKVLLGTIQGFTPTNVATNIDVSGTDGTWTIYMHATLSGTTVTAVEVLTDNTGGAVPSDDATNSYRLIGRVVVASSLITSVSPSMAWSMALTICTAGTPPYSWTTGA